MSKTFRLDRRNGKLMGVCAGIANYTGLDATLVRVGVVIVTLLGAFPWSLIAYGITAWIAGRETGGSQPEGIRRSKTSVHEVRTNMRDMDRRMAEVDRYVATTNTRLAREIDELR